MPQRSLTGQRHSRDTRPINVGRGLRTVDRNGLREGLRRTQQPVLAGSLLRVLRDTGQCCLLARVVSTLRQAWLTTRSYAEARSSCVSYLVPVATESWHTSRTTLWSRGVPEVLGHPLASSCFHAVGRSLPLLSGGHTLHTAVWRQESQTFYAPLHRSIIGSSGATMQCLRICVGGRAAAAGVVCKTVVVLCSGACFRRSWCVAMDRDDLCFS